MIARRYQGRQSSNRAEAILARYPDLESGNFYGMVKPDDLVKVTLRRIPRLLVSLSFCLMVGLGLLMAHGIAPGRPVQERLDLWGWIDYPGNSVANVFFTLAALNLLIVWAWLIRCAAKGDFLRLAEGILVGSAVVGTLLFLTPTYCSRSPRRIGETGRYCLFCQATQR